MEQLISSLIGGIFRLAPEIMKLIGKYFDNKHEIEMLKQSAVIDNNRLNHQVQMETAVRSGQTNVDFDSIIKLQSRKTGYKFIDMINALVRPYVTYIVLGLYAVIKLYFLFAVGLPITAIWTVEDMSLLCGILSFWFIGRVLDNKK